MGGDLMARIGVFSPEKLEAAQLSDELRRRYPSNGLLSTTRRSPLSNDPLCKVSEGRPPRFNRTRD
jgi:hypothetical protein